MRTTVRTTLVLVVLPIVLFAAASITLAIWANDVIRPESGEVAAVLVAMTGALMLAVLMVKVLHSIFDLVDARERRARQHA